MCLCQKFRPKIRFIAWILMIDQPCADRSTNRILNRVVHWFNLPFPHTIFNLVKENWEKWMRKNSSIKCVLENHPWCWSFCTRTPELLSDRTSINPPFKEWCGNAQECRVSSVALLDWWSEHWLGASRHKDTYFSIVGEFPKKKVSFLGHWKIKSIKPILLYFVHSGMNWAYF